MLHIFLRIRLELAQSFTKLVSNMRNVLQALFHHVALLTIF